MKRICVFCGASSGSDPVYLQAAREAGRTLARRGLTLVYGGGSVGLMGAIADGTLEAGGEVIGVIPRALQLRELAHAKLTSLHVVSSMHERKAKMAELAHGFVALPGGLGTLEEFCEIVTWAQLGLHARPCGLLDVAGYWKSFIGFLDQAVSQGFVKGDHRRMVQVASNFDALLDGFAAYQPPAVEKWIDKGTA